MANPELFVDQREQLEHRSALVVGDADIGQAQHLQHMILAPPYSAQGVVRPAALDLTRDLVLADEFARPAARLEQRSEHIDGGGIVVVPVHVMGDLHHGGEMQREGAVGQ